MVTFQDRIWEVFEQEKDKEHKCTREKFAKKCGVSKGQMDGYVKGNGQLFCNILEAISANNKVSIGWLTGVSDDR